MTLAK